VVAGQSWGGNVVLQLAADHPDLPHAIAAVDGGWIHLADVFPSWEQCAARLAPPDFTGARAADIEARLRAAHPGWPESGIAGTLANFRIDPDGTAHPRLTRARHMTILRSLWDHTPRALYPRITVPVLLVPAGHAARSSVEPPDEAAAPAGATANGPVAEAARALKDAVVRAYPDADHDVHAQHPAEVAADLLRLDSTPGPGRPTARGEPG
jgi:pimeloyl-ACP methyl ester carboxylesterase